MTLFCPYSHFITTLDSLTYTTVVIVITTLKIHFTSHITITLTFLSPAPPLFPPLKMDTLLLHHTPRPCSATSKRPYAAVSSPSDPLSPMSQDRISLLESFLSLSDQTTIPLLDHAFDTLIESSGSEYDQSIMIERALKLGSVLLEAGKRSARKRDCLRNAVVWPLPPDLTIKVVG